jgi:hypothetical protein
MESIYCEDKKVKTKKTLFIEVCILKMIWTKNYLKDNKKLYLNIFYMFSVWITVKMNDEIIDRCKKK